MPLIEHKRTHVDSEDKIEGVPASSVAHRNAALVDIAARRQEARDMQLRLADRRRDPK